MKSRHYIAVTGSIGVGKTTTVNGLVAALDDCIGFYEVRDKYLQRFYNDQNKFAFLNQLAYSLQYLEQASEIAALSSNIAQDRSIYDTHQVFSEWRHSIGLIDDDEFELLARVFRSTDRIVRPTLVVLLETSVDLAMARIAERQLPTEMGLTSEFLADLSEQYSSWFSKFDLCQKIKLRSDNESPEHIVRAILQTVA